MTGIRCNHCGSPRDEAARMFTIERIAPCTLCGNPRWAAGTAAPTRIPPRPGFPGNLHSAQVCRRSSHRAAMARRRSRSDV